MFEGINRKFSEEALRKNKNNALKKLLKVSLEGVLNKFLKDFFAGITEGNHAPIFEGFLHFFLGKSLEK